MRGRSPEHPSERQTPPLTQSVLWQPSWQLANPSSFSRPAIAFRLSVQPRITLHSFLHQPILRKHALLGAFAAKASPRRFRHLHWGSQLARSRQGGSLRWEIDLGHRRWGCGLVGAGGGAVAGAPARAAGALQRDCACANRRGYRQIQPPVSRRVRY